MTGVEGLNRDISKARYSTKEGGLQGGFTVDDTLVNTLRNPEKAYTETVKQVVNGLNDAKKTVDLIYDESGKVVENASNWVDDHLFTSDDEENPNEQQTDNDSAAGKDDNQPTEGNDSSTDKSIQDMADLKLAEGQHNPVDETLTGNAKEVAEIKDKLDRGEPLSPEDLKTYFDSIHQYSKGGTTLQTEINNIISENPESFRAIMSAAGYNVEDPSQVEKFAKITQKGFCVQNTNYTQLVFNGVDGSPESTGDYYKELVDNKLIDEKGNQVASTQKVFDTICGEGQVSVYGYGTDPGGGSFIDENSKTSTAGSNGSIIMTKLKDAMNNTDDPVNVITVRVDTGGGNHNMNIINNGNGNYTLNDSSFRGTNIPVYDEDGNYTEEFLQYIKPKNIKSFNYIREN